MITLFKPTMTLIFVSVMLITLAQSSPPSIKNSGIDKVGSGGQSSNPMITGSSFNYNNVWKMGEVTDMYLDKEWLPGKIILKQGTEIDNLFLRYNLYTCQMEYTDGLDTMAIGNPEDVYRVKMGDRDFMFADQVHNETHPAYLELLVDGQYKLLCCRRIKYTMIESETGGKPEKKFYLDKKLFYLSGNDKPFAVPQKRKSAVVEFGKEFTGLKSYLKKNKIRLKSESDYILLFQYLNENL